MSREIAKRTRCPGCAQSNSDTDCDNLAHYEDGSVCMKPCGYINKNNKSTKIKADKVMSELIPGHVVELKERGLSYETCVKYNVRTAEFSGYIGQHKVEDELVKIFPYTKNGSTVRQKIKAKSDKKIMAQKGDTSSIVMFGQNIFSPTSKLPIVITEGEEDAMAVHQMTGLPAISIINGCGSAAKDISNNLEYLMGWREVLLCFDSDDAGQKAFTECLKLFEPGYAKKVNLPLKDANEMLLAGREEEMKKATWNAEVVRPRTIVFPKDIREKVLTKPEFGVAFPWTSMTKATYGMRGGEVYMLAAATSIGKQLANSALLSTPNGWIKNGEVAIGDVLHGYAGTTRVIGVYPQGIKDIYKVTFDDGRQVDAGLEHLWEVRTKSQVENTRLGKEQHMVMTTKQIIAYREKHINGIYIKVCKPVENTDKDFIIPPYSMGVLLGDGCLTGSGIQVSSSEKDIINRVEYELGLTAIKNNNNYTYTFITQGVNYEYRKYIVEKELNVTSDNKFIPKEYLHGSIEQRRDLLAGLIDTDGSISVQSGSYTFSTTSTKLKEGFVELCQSLGYKAKVRKENRIKYKSSVCWIVAIKTSDRIFKSHKHKARFESYGYKGNRIYFNDHLKIIDISFDRVEEATCIEVDAPDCLYLTNGYVVTHNTEVMRQIVEHFLSQGTKVGLFSFEQQPEQTLQRFIGGQLNKRLHIPGELWEDEEILKGLDNLEDNVALYQPESGIVTLESVLINIRFLAKAHKMTFFVVDNLKALSVNPVIDSKRVAVHDFVSHSVSQFVALAKQLNINIFLVNHLSADKIGLSAYVTTSPKNSDAYLSRTAEEQQEFVNRPGLTWESGRVPTIENIFGGGATKDLVDYILVLSRNRVSKDEEEHRTTKVTFLKTRLDSNFEGFSFKLKYSFATGNLIEDFTQTCDNRDDTEVNLKRNVDIDKQISDFI